MKEYNVIILMFLVMMVMASCNNSAADAGDEDVAPEDVVTPVTVTHPSTSNMQQTVEINAVAAYLLKTYVKANAVGYLQVANIHLGQFVTKGQTLFVIKT